jgi:hypothetical protein
MEAHGYDGGPDPLNDLRTSAVAWSTSCSRSPKRNPARHRTPWKAILTNAPGVHARLPPAANSGRNKQVLDAATEWTDYLCRENKSDPGPVSDRSLES